jgi:type I restriction enzyme, R subunit
LRAAASDESFQFPARIDGVQELAQEKLAPLLRLRYQHSIADAVADLGKPEQIGQLFAGFQRLLDEPAR